MCDSLALARSRRGGCLRVASISHLNLAACVTYLILASLSLFLVFSPDLGALSKALSTHIPPHTLTFT